MDSCEAPGLLGTAPSPGALAPRPAMAAAAAAATAVGSAGKMPAAAVAVALPVEAPPWTSSATPTSPVTLRPITATPLRQWVQIQINNGHVVKREVYGWQQGKTKSLDACTVQGHGDFSCTPQGS